MFEAKNKTLSSHLDCVLRAGVCLVPIYGGVHDQTFRGYYVSCPCRVIDRKKDKLVGAIHARFVENVRHPHLVARTNHFTHGLRHDDVVVPLGVRAPQVTIRAESSHPRAAFVLT